MAVSGWYPDPAGTAQLRFFDGQSWTTATASPPIAQPAFAPPAAPTAPHYTPQPAPHYAQQYSSKRPPERGRRFWSVVASLVVAGAVIAAAIPLVSGSHHAPTTEAFNGALLTLDEVSATAGDTFVIEPPDSSDDGTDDGTSSDDCAGTDLSKVAGPNAVTAEADRSYSASSDGKYVDEDLSYIPGKAAAILNTLKPEVAACHSLDGGKLAVSVLPAPPVAGSDDTFAMQFLGQVGDQTIVVDVELARFGDSLVGVSYAAPGDPDDIGATTGVLLTQAATKAKHLF